MIDSWEGFYQAVKHERERLEAEVDEAIKDREKRLHIMQQKTFEMIGEKYE